MTPVIFNYDKQYCKMKLRKYELEAYSAVVTAFRAQGDLDLERKKILRDLASVMSIPLERHRAEVNRAISDEKLDSISCQLFGSMNNQQWLIEAKRIIPRVCRSDNMVKFLNMVDKRDYAILNQSKQIGKSKSKVSSMPTVDKIIIKRSFIENDSQESKASKKGNPTYILTNVPTRRSNRNSKSFEIDSIDSTTSESSIISESSDLNSDNNKSAISSKSDIKQCKRKTFTKKCEHFPSKAIKSSESVEEKRCSTSVSYVFEPSTSYSSTTETTSIDHNEEDESKEASDKKQLSIYKIFETLMEDS